MRRVTIIEVCAFMLSAAIFGATVALDIVGHLLADSGYPDLYDAASSASAYTKLVLLASFLLCYGAYRLAKRIEAKY